MCLLPFSSLDIALAFERALPHQYISEACCIPAIQQQLHVSQTGGGRQQQWLKACTGQAGELLTASTVAVMRFLHQKLFLSHVVNCNSITASFAYSRSNGLPLVWLRSLASHTISVCWLYFVEFSGVVFFVWLCCFVFSFFFNTTLLSPPGG